MENNQTEIKKGDVLIASGHRACAGCGLLVSAMAATRAMGPDVIIANATGCSEVTTTPYPESSWKVPWIHSLFENASAVASGIRAALDHKEKQLLPPPLTPPLAWDGQHDHIGKIKVIAQGGDGATFDIGIGLISGMWERGDDVIYICYDTEIYSNTGYQASGSTPTGASTSTAPAGKRSVGSAQRKKDMIGIALAHGLKYVAQSSAGYPLDITAKVKKALEMGGPAYIQILCPCIPGWGLKSSDAVKAGKLAVETGLYPLLEYVDGQLVSHSKIKEKKPVDEYLKIQARFKHLFTSQEGKDELQCIQVIADRNITKFGLIADLE
jgi:pyruvate ferredoxin oxidoreductase beta subunit